MSCVYCAPKSRISIREWDKAAMRALRCWNEAAESTRPADAGLALLVSFDPVVGGFLHDLNVVNVRLADAGRRDLDEFGARAQLLDGGAAAVAHRRTQAAHQLVNDVDQRTLERNAPLDALGDELLG